MKKRIEKLEIEGITYVPESDKTENDIKKLDLLCNDFLIGEKGESGNYFARVLNRNGTETEIDNSTLMEAAMFLFKLHMENQKEK